MKMVAKNKFDEIPEGPVTSAKSKGVDTIDFDGTQSLGSSSTLSKDEKKAPSIKPASFLSLFQFAETRDILVLLMGVFFCVLSGATMPSINIIFGDMIDNIASPVNQEEMLGKSIRAMLLLGTYGFVTFFMSFLCCGFAATSIANGFRTKYLEALLVQDMTFFDNAEPGSLTLMLSDSTMEIQTGLSEKFVQAIQGFFQFVFGFGIAFYFGPKLSLVLLACVPLLAIITTCMFMWGASDGLYGKEAYEKASEIASEVISNIRTIISLNAETVMSRKYDSKLSDSEKASIRQSTRVAFLAGLLFFVIFCMYGLGFWYGAILIAQSTDDAIAAHPAPGGLLDPNGPWYETIQVYCSQYLDNLEALQVCACGFIPWDTIEDITGPNCGCGYLEDSSGMDQLGLTVLTGCISGGRTMMVFFSILIGGFSVGQIGPGAQALANAQIAAAKLLEVINNKPTIGVGNDEAGGKGLKRDDVDGEITLKNLHFRYERKHSKSSEKDEIDNNVDINTQQVVFGGCDLTMKAGETVALVGESGCGKSTIAKLVQRFYDPTDGCILLDGVDLRNINVHDLRSCIGVVSQEPLLFDTTIEENIRFGKPGATFEEIVQAARSANAHEFITSFPEGYQTMVGPKGGKLSGGQKQRVAISRAILRDPPILILDEATSALDNKSEKLVQQALDRLIKHEDGGAAARKRTIIVIAHRLSTVRNADKIVVLGSPAGTSAAITGSVILEQGNHEELIKLENGFYRALAGAGLKSKAFVDDLSSSDGMVIAVEENVELTDEETYTENVKDEMKTKEEKSTFWNSLKKSKDSDAAEKEKMEKEMLKKNKARVWSYTKPEMGWIVFGAVASAIKGAVNPLMSIAFVEMIVVWFDSDTEYMIRKSLHWSYMFYGLAITVMATELIQKSVFEMVGERLTTRLRGDLFRAILRKDVAWFEDDKNAVGFLASRLSTDVKLVRLVAGQSIAALLECSSSLLVGIIISLTASWEVCLIMFAMVPALGLAQYLQFAAMKSSEGTIREELSRATDLLHETVHAIREVQSYSLQQNFIDDIEKRIKDSIIPASKKGAIFKGFGMGLIQLIQFYVYAFAFWFGGKMIAQKRTDFGDFNKAVFAMAFAANGLGQGAMFFGDAAKAASAVNAIFAILDYVPAIDSAPWENNGIANINTNKATDRQLQNSTLKDGKGELSAVNFSYPTRKTAKIFDQIDIQIPKGKVVALVGSSGSGKSTVVQLLMRFYDPVSYKETNSDKNAQIDVVIEDGNLSAVDGIVKIDDNDLRTSDCRWLRNSMGYVGQEPILFDDTIYNNIALGKEGCTQDEVEAAARNANAYNFIMKLDEGFDTMVGMGGGKISGGQKQRIAIARALVSDPKILILDEATSALDNESEKIVQETLDALMKESNGKRTTIVIAHRLSTIKGADCICVLENNGDGSKVVEIGTHDELLQLGQKYKALVQAYENH